MYVFNDTSFQVYIGDLGNEATRYELEDAFTPFGVVKNVWIAKRPPGKIHFLSARYFTDKLIILQDLLSC